MNEPLQSAIATVLDPSRPLAGGLMQLLIAAPSPAAAITALHSARANATSDNLARLEEAEVLLAAHPHAFQTIRATLDGLEHAPGHSPEDWATLFDRAVRTAPEASVALYSLGSPALLAAATQEVVAWLKGRQLIGPDASVLDLGCGIGRFAQALSPLVHRVVGIDVSTGMVEEARRRCHGLSNVQIEQTTGRSLAGFDAGTFDLVLAVDSFPYLVLADLASCFVAESARVLRPLGALMMLNYSYRGNLATDVAEVARLGHAADLRVIDAGAQPFRTWDGAVFHLALSADHRGPPYQEASITD